MHLASVKTSRNFVAFVRDLVKRGNIEFEGSLEDYLRALWGVILKNRDIPPSWMLFAYLVEEAFYVPPVPFNESWMAYDSLPELEGVPEHSFAALQGTILHQIAEWRRMQLAGTLDLPGNILWMGVVTPSGHGWYNFDPFSFLRQGVMTFRTDEEIFECDWYELAIMLWCGQIYE